MGGKKLTKEYEIQKIKKELNIELKHKCIVDKEIINQYNNLINKIDNVKKSLLYN